MKKTLLIIMVIFFSSSIAIAKNDFERTSDAAKKTGDNTTKAVVKTLGTGTKSDEDKSPHLKCADGKKKCPCDIQDTCCDNNQTCKCDGVGVAWCQ
jgi:hypothetical protein